MFSRHMEERAAKELTGDEMIKARDYVLLHAWFITSRERVDEALHDAYLSGFIHGKEVFTPKLCYHGRLSGQCGVCK